MTKADLLAVKQALVGAGVEIFRTRPNEICIAERIRLHIMDSGIRVNFDAESRVFFAARSQRSDFPHSEGLDLFERVRSAVADAAQERGYAEHAEDIVEVRDPSNEATILDTWHVVTYAKPVNEIADAVEEVQWALSVNKYITG